MERVWEDTTHGSAGTCSSRSSGHVDAAAHPVAVDRSPALVTWSAVRTWQKMARFWFWRVGMYARRGAEAKHKLTSTRSAQAQWFGGAAPGKGRPRCHHGAAGPAGTPAAREWDSRTTGKAEAEPEKPGTPDRAECGLGLWVHRAHNIRGLPVGSSHHDWRRLPWSVVRVDDGPDDVPPRLPHPPRTSPPPRGLRGTAGSEDVGYCEADRPSPSPSQRGPCKRLAVVGSSPLPEPRVRSIGRRCPARSLSFSL